MAKDKSKKPKKAAEDGAKKSKKSGKAKAKPTAAISKPPAKPGKKAADIVRTAKSAASEIAQHPVVAEVVAATLVAAAAALRDPQKARDLAASAKQGLTAASKGGQGNALWTLAMDVARRSVETLGGDGDAATKKGKRKPPADA